MNHQCYYFAYGSNLNPSRLKSRTRTWDGQYKIARLKQHELRFNMCVDTVAHAIRVGANIMPHPTRCVQGILIRLDWNDLVEIDQYEGHPELYQRIVCQVETENCFGIEAFTYVAQSQWLKENVLPSREYLEHIIQGALLCGLPCAYINAIRELGGG
ncbi:gamma-glutamylcyclotransferase family protein [Leptolyngbya sp. GGD]|uniref:gamma-glutamylcyclotransferase family protein n=1 Tax=Leptolyngbya sp. GGD TaxID=2997907 RepID=UPI00227A983F|nr:gamma-glutamylcyclotransferase family protein [Leptolyngbya sp. GGD]MCY6494568.1 gamma-glutamylcyclotransferase [Leptolyngbya sp. GGD]